MFFSFWDFPYFFSFLRKKAQQTFIRIKFVRKLIVNKYLHNATTSESCVQSFLSPPVCVVSVALVVPVAMKSMELFMYLVSLGFQIGWFVVIQFYMLQTDGRMSKTDEFSIHRSIG